ncbi:MAG: alpha-amylase [Rhodobacterales bacterium]|nr:alpha-amylase [Rhodobacterales bacterium]
MRTAALSPSLVWVAASKEPGPWAEAPAMTSEVDDWRDEVIYQLLVDRFANGDRNNDYNVTHNEDALAKYMGGDYQGVIDNVAYFEALGVTTVWISPVVINVEEDAGVSSYHGYWTQDFMGVNPHFGDMAKLREMVSVLHEHDIKVIVDIVVNHVGQLFYYDINRNGQPDTTIFGAGDQDSEDGFWEDPIEVITEWDPKYEAEGVQAWTSLGPSGESPLGWVYMPEINRIPPNPPEFHNDSWYNRRGRVVDWNQEDQVVKGDFPGGLKDLDTNKVEVREALIDVFAWWIEQTNIDGYRIDTVKHVEHSFWQQFNPQIRSRAKANGKDRFLQFGEVFDGDDAKIGSYTFDGELDSLFYFSHKFQVFDDIYKYGGPTSSVERLYAERSVNYGAAPHENGITGNPQETLITFIDNHDIPRFLYDQPSEEALAAALVHLMTMDGIPCLYYGTEQSFDGGNDPANRAPLWWDGGLDTQSPMFVHVAGLTKLRKAYVALRRGGFEVKWASDRVDGEEDAHLVAFERATADGDRALVVINTAGEGSAHTSFGGSDMPVGFAPGTDLTVVFPVDDGRTFSVSQGGTVRVSVEPYEALVLVPASDVLPL